MPSLCVSDKITIPTHPSRVMDHQILPASEDEVNFRVAQLKKSISITLFPAKFQTIMVLQRNIPYIINITH
jgi:hypothetical protein